MRDQITANLLFAVLFPDPGDPLKWLRREKMKKTYQLIKLKTGTVKELKRLMGEMAEGSLDGLINTMIRFTVEYRLVLKDTGWRTLRKR